MALRHAILAALIDGEASGYTLSKVFDVAVSDFWQASPQQIYVELAKLESADLVRGREVVQTGRPNKRVFTLTDGGREELLQFSRRPAKPSAVRDDLMVKLHAGEAGDVDALIHQLEERATQAQAKIDMFRGLLDLMRGDRDEAEHLERAERIGPYLTCLRGLLFEQENLISCEWGAQVLRARRDGTQLPPMPEGLLPRKGQP